MNTPFPCNRCKYLWYNCMTEDNPDDQADCTIVMDQISGKKPLWGSVKCPRFEPDPHILTQIFKGDQS